MKTTYRVASEILFILQFKGHNDIIHLNRLNVAGLFACHRRFNMSVSVIVYAGSAASGLFGWMTSELCLISTGG